MLLEVCVEDVVGLSKAIEGGADRIELCSALAVGGLTPSAGLMADAGRRSVPSYAMIRPRAGSFEFSAEELDVMRADIDAARNAGLPGVVLGASMPDGRLDRRALEILVGQSDGLGKTLHRAFDLVPDIEEAVELAVELGFERILTSGRERTASEGVVTIELAIVAAAGRISIMPGSGINLKSIGGLLPRLAVSEVHASCSVSETEESQRLLDLGFSTPVARRTDSATVRALKARIG